MGRCPTLTTDRLVLRPFRDDDTDAYTAVLTSPGVRRSLHLPEGLGRTEAWSQMAAWLGQWELRGTGQWALEERATGRFVGRAGTHRPERPDWPGIEIGWVLDPDVWGRGYATEAGARAVEHAFESFGDVQEVFSVILPENAPSQAVARRLGFELVEERTLSHFPSMPHGIWRLDRDRWSMTR